MSKPWDKLREPVKTPMQPGEWLTNGGTRIRLYRALNVGTVCVGVGSVGLPEMSPKSIREVGEFLIELADQAEGK